MTMPQFASTISTWRFGAMPPGAKTQQMDTARPSTPTIHIVGFDTVAQQRLSGLIRDASLNAAGHGSIHDFLAADLAQAPGCAVIRAHPALAGVLALLAQFPGAGAGLPIVVVAGCADDATAALAARAGAVAVLYEPLREGVVLEAIARAQRIHEIRRCADRRRKAVRAGFDRLTHRERQVMALVTQGLLNKQVAGDLGISEITVKAHRGSVMRKMGARTLADLVRMADMLVEDR